MHIQLQQTVRPHSARQIGAIVLAGLMLLVLLMQLIPYGREHTNPPVIAEPAWDSPQTRALFFRACADCHSNETTWPWYSNIAPASWLITRDVTQGRAEFNVSEWGRPDNDGDDAAKLVQNGEMPPWFYLPLHPEANLSPVERQQLINGLLATFGGEVEGENER
ncbi:heme-binding domain-containing protein [Roseiflexus sp.]|uniref:heme-binding domain-containing protein n=1 Tax=Roseiflexus sp. TaxID=2562120 RepID=UPI00398ADAEE